MSARRQNPATPLSSASRLIGPMRMDRITPDDAWAPVLYNGSGRDAVLVTQRDGKRFLLGTGEPETLAQAIRTVR